MFKKILVPLDTSNMAEAVLPTVRELAQCFGAEVVALHVVVPMPPSLYGAGYVNLPDLEQALRSEGNSYVHHVAANLNDRGIKTTAVLKEASAVADAILNYAEANGVDLIAMSTHGRSGIGRWLLGSVADRVVHGSQVPVLLVRPNLS